MRRARLAAALTLAVLVACGTGTPERAATRTVRVILSHFRFAPDKVTVEAGTTLRFVLVNSDPIPHEFVLGSEEAQKEHERMQMGGGHMMEESTGMRKEGPGIASVPAGKTVNLSYTFSRAGRVIYGCHVDDHYAQGMKGIVSVTP
jgi:uncharacterized cupredoxin-like copper-binding protein